MPRFRNLTGQRFGRLKATAPKRVQRNSRTRIYWRCVCDCGRSTLVAASNLTNGNVRSCGCLPIPGNFKHGHARKGAIRPEYHVWQGIKKRCMNRHANNWKDYGKRGIAVCKRWLQSFDNFWKDMGPRPSPQHTLGRLNNDGDYKKSNCAWQLPEEQANNTRRNVRCALYGIELTLTQWTRVVPVDRSVINYYFNVRKFNVEQALRKAWTADRCMRWFDEEPTWLSRVAVFRARHPNLSVRDAALAVICKEHRAVRRK